VLIYPMLDATASSASYEEFVEGYGFSSKKSRWYFDQYLPAGIDRRAPRVSPLFDRGLSNLPATLIVTAAFDPLRDDGERHAKRLRDAGVTVELRRYGGMIHGFFQMTRHLKAHGGCIASSANGCVRPRVTDLHDRRGTDERKHRGMRRGRRVSPLIFSSCDALCVRGRVIVFRVASLPRFVIDRGRCRDGTAWASSEAEGASP